MRDQEIAAVLDELTPRFKSEPGDWDRVLTEGLASGFGLTSTPRRKFILALTAVAVIATLIAVPALAISQGWWFPKSPDWPQPIGNVATVKTLEVDDGSLWNLDAYLTQGGGLCYGINRTGGINESGSAACGPELAQQPSPKPGADYNVLGYLAVGFSGNVEFICGETAPDVVTIDVTLADGNVISTATVPAPESLETPLRFYFTEIPEDNDTPSKLPNGQLGSPVSKIVGKNTEGRTVGTISLSLSTNR
jgi:hypothetical protein